MYTHSSRGFVSLVFILVAVLATTVVTGAGYGIYKYQQTAKENRLLKEEAAAQKDQQIQKLQEELETVTSQEERQSKSAENENKPVVTEEVSTTESYSALLEQQRINTQKIREELLQHEKVTTDASLLLSETCKAKRDAKKTQLWNAMLVAVDLVEQQNEEETLDMLMDEIPLGSLPATSLVNFAKTSDEEHAKNLSIAETQLESTLAEFYEECLQG